MVDTISINISIKNQTGECIEVEIISILYNAIRRLSYQNKISLLANNDSLNVVISYPKYYYPTNVYLISKSVECSQVNNDFIVYLRNCIIFDEVGNYRPNYMALQNYFENNIIISLIRVDTPFTYFMKEEETFYSYKNVYKLLTYIYMQNNTKARPKSYNDFEKGNIETLIFTNTSNVGAYNRKITIYNQSNKISDYYQNNSTLFDQIMKDYPDLQNRIRIEVSKRIRNRIFSPEEFRNFNVFDKYVLSFAEYALENMFNKNILIEVIANQKEKLKMLLQQERQAIYFTYENFIYKYLEEIWDYEILRQAIMETSFNDNSGYHACSTVKNILIKIQQNNDILYLGVIKKVNDMINYFEQLKRRY